MADKENYLTPTEVHERWNKRITVKTLANWRSDKSAAGPRFVRFGNKVMYPESALMAWESEHTYGSTQDYYRPKAA